MAVSSWGTRMGAHRAARFGDGLGPPREAGKPHPHPLCGVEVEGRGC